MKFCSNFHGTIPMLVVVVLCHLELTDGAVGSHSRRVYGFPYETKKRADADVPIFHEPSTAGPVTHVTAEAAKATEGALTTEAEEDSYVNVIPNRNPVLESSNNDEETVEDYDDEKNLDVREEFLDYDLFEGKAEKVGHGNGEILQDIEPGNVGSGARGRAAMDPELFEEEKLVLFSITTTHHPSPHIDFTNEAVLHYDQTCKVYGEHINEVQWSVDPVLEKKKKLGGEETVEYFGTQICDFLHKRLECVPNEPRAQITPPPKRDAEGNIIGGPGDDAGDGGGEVGNEDDEVAAFLKPTGKCKCLRALGEKAEWWLEESSNNYKCFIPADLGLWSSCGFDVHYPYGEILDSPLNIKRSFSAALACTEHSSCTTGYTYTGLRCHCNKGTHMNKLTPGKCTPDSLGHAIRSEEVCILFMSIAITFLSFITPM